jgi:hypothetical protein
MRRRLHHRGHEGHKAQKFLFLIFVSFVSSVVNLCGCSAYDAGVEALMRVDGAQFYRGLPPAAEDGPSMVSFTFSSTHVAPGMKSKPAGGNVTIDTTAIAIWLDGDVGYWIFEPGAIDPQVLNQLTYSVKLSFSPFLPNGKHTVSARSAPTSSLPRCRRAPPW